MIRKIFAVMDGGEFQAFFATIEEAQSYVDSENIRLSEADTASYSGDNRSGWHPHYYAVEVDLEKIGQEIIDLAEKFEYDETQ